MPDRNGSTPWRRAGRRRALCALCALAAATLAGAERLPLVGGRWIEIRGEPRVEGDRVVYLSREGNLRSLPLAELAPDAAPEGALSGALREYPSDTPILFVPPAPPPAAPLPRAAGRAPIPPRCWLANPRPEEPPLLLCGGEAAPAPPATAAPGRIPDGRAPVAAQGSSESSGDS